jgi:hypothetical protein
MKKSELLKEIELLKTRVSVLETTVRYITGNIYWTQHVPVVQPHLGDPVITWPGNEQALVNTNNLKTHT